MSINATQLRTLIIQPVLKYLNLWSQEAEDLLMGTAAQESNLGTYLKQEGNGPAVGIYQMQENAHDDIWLNYLKNHPILVQSIMTLCNFNAVPTEPTMLHNLYYATAMARIYYLRDPGVIPASLADQAAYYKKYWNTHLGAATPEEYIANYHKYVGTE